MKKSDKRTCFIFNVSARQGRSAKLVDWLKQEASLRWNDFDILVTGDAAPDPVTHKLNEYDMLVACGGDGTIHHTANLALKLNLPVGLLPVGSGNDFAKALNLPASKEECLDIIARAKLRRVDIIHCGGDTDRWCVNTLGIGFDGLTNKITEGYKKWMGSLGYYAGALHATLVYRGQKMYVQSKEVELDEKLLMITACNGQVEGGAFHVAPDAEIDDGLIDLLVIKPVPLLKLWWYLPKFRKRLPDEMKEISQYRCSSFVLQTEKGISVHADGEQLGNSIHRIEVVLHPQALSVAVP